MLGVVGQKRPDRSSWRRKALAAHILAAAEYDLGITTTKFRKMFKEELLEASRSGILDPQLWELVFQITETWWLDTQEVEGTNSIIKAIHKTSPNVGVDAHGKPRHEQKKHARL